MKKYILISLITFSSIAALAQSGYNYNSFGFGIGASITRPRADLKKQIQDKAFSATFMYYYNPYTPVAIEFQTGHLRGGGNSIAEDKDTRRFDNSYKSLTLHIDYQIGDMLDYDHNFFANLVKNFYVGGGVGFISNNVDVNRFSRIVPEYKFPGVDKSVNFMVPLRVGYEIKIYDYYGVPKFGILLSYEHNVTFGEGLDGYDDPGSKFKNNALDQYRQISVGFKYNFGALQPYDKSIKSNY